MTGYRPGPGARSDPGASRGPRRTLGPYGPRDDPGPEDPGGRYDAPPRTQRPPAHPWEQPGPPRPAVPRDNTGGAEGNERLTAAAGAVLLVLFAAEGVTILSIHQLITVHFFLGMLLIGPVALKVGAVLYRFTRYYAGVPGYRRKGPPAPLLRLLGPFVVITSVGVIGTGVVGWPSPGHPPAAGSSCTRRSSCSGSA